MIQYIALCIASVLAGRGWVRIFGLGGSPRGAELLAPALTMSLWAVALGSSISLGFPISRVWQAMYVATVVLAVIGIAGKNIIQEIRNSAWLVFMLVLPPLFLYPYVLHGIFSYVGSPAWDGWSYVAVGQYLWEYPLGSDGGLQPLYQYSAHLAGTRFVGSGLLGLFSPLALQPGESYLSRGLFILWTFFVSGCSVLYFAQQFNKGKRFRILYTVMALCSGWMIMAVFANNYDNLVFLALMPAFAAYCYAGDIAEYKSYLPAGILMAGMLYTYPEMSIFALFIGLVLLWGRNGPAARKLVFIAATVSIALILLAPYFKVLVAFFQNQLISAKSSSLARPGEGMFPELLRLSVAFPAYWGIWVRSLENPVPLTNAVRLFFAYSGAAVCTLLFISGCQYMARRREGSVLIASSVMIGGSLYFLLLQHYDYGAYKIILLNWWLVSFICVNGIEAVLDDIGRNWGEKMKLRVWGVALLVLAVVGWGKAGALDNTVQTKDMQYFQAIQTAIPASDGHSLALNVNDDAASAWAVYFLRNQPLQILSYKHYMAQPHVVPYMERAKKIDSASVKYVISDAGECLDNAELKILIPKAGRYCVMEVRQPGGFDVIRVNNPNGHESAEGKPFYWLGNGNTEITIVSTNAHDAAIDMELTPGPSLPESVPRRLRITSDKLSQQEFLIARQEKISYALHLEAGDNKIILTTLDKPGAGGQPNGDTRPLLLLLRNIQVRTVY